MGNSKGVIHGSIIVTAVTIVYLNSLAGVFLFDDDSAIVENAAIRDLWSFDWFELRGRPITTFTLAINYALGGLNPIGYHLVNIAIHIANSLLLYRLLAASLEALESSGTKIRLNKSPQSFAFLSTLLWAVHPLCTQAVTYTIQRSESLAALGILATLYCWGMASKARTEDRHELGSTNGQAGKLLSGASIGWSLGAAASAMVAYGSKESAAFLPVIVLLYDRIFISQSWTGVKSKALWHGVISLPVLIGAGIYAVAFLGSEHQDQTVGFTMERITPWSYFGSQPAVFFQYLRLSVVPVGQTLDYGWLPSRAHADVALGAMLWAIIVFTVFWLLWRKPPLGFVFAASLLILAPSSTFMPLQDIIFEHRFYLPLASVCIVVVVFADWAGDFVSNWLRLRSNRWQWIVGSSVVIMLSILTVDRNRDYSSRERMFASDAENHPDNPRTWANLAVESNFDNPDDCIAMYEKSLQLYQQRGFFYAGTRYKLTRAIGDIYFLTGRLEPASQYLELALESANDRLQEAEVHFSLAMIASVRGETASADRHFELAIREADTLRGLREAYAVHLRRTGRDAAAEKIVAER
jgi:protein O-mannosyl-transferase